MAAPAFAVQLCTATTNRERMAWRDPFGDLPAVVDSARAELAAGHLENAWTAYQIALEQWLQQTWRSRPGKANSPVKDSEALLQKLRSAGLVDDWMNQAIRFTFKRPLPVARWHVEILAAVVSAVTCEEGRATE